MTGARVVKAFNTQFAARQADPTVSGLRVDGFVAADDEEAKATVLGLVEAIGFNPVDAGELAKARELEALAWLNITLQMRHGWSWQAGWKLVGPRATRPEQSKRAGRLCGRPARFASAPSVQRSRRHLARPEHLVTRRFAVVPRGEQPHAPRRPRRD